MLINLEYSVKQLDPSDHQTRILYIDYYTTISSQHENIPGFDFRYLRFELSYSERLSNILVHKYVRRKAD